MRRLLYVPIVHSEVDMGRAGAALVQASEALSGGWRWAVHQETVGRFWDSVDGYLSTFECRRLRVYQDGLPVGGEEGRRVVEEAAARGSRNYQLILGLLRGGAELRKTEDPALLVEEREWLSGELARHAGEEGSRKRQDELLERRDRFISEAISATLREEEVGVLFLGARHNVARWLPPDIAMHAVKEPEQVQAYMNELFFGQDDGKLEELARALAAPARPR